MTYDLGIVIPVYHSTVSVKKLVIAIEKIFLPDISIRICLVDDSNDETTAAYLKENCLRPEVTLIILDGNYGQQEATKCGLEHLPPCQIYATIDDDLEQPARMLLLLYRRLLAGCDLVYAIPAAKGQNRPLLRRWGSGLRDIMFWRLLGAPQNRKVSSLRAMKARVVKESLAYQRAKGDDSFFYLSAAVLKSAKKKRRKLRIENLSYKPRQRYDGVSGYSARQLIILYGRIFWHYGLGLPGNKQAKKGYIIKEMVRSERIMLLGGSNCQLHGAERANALGVDTVLADYTSQPPAAAVCRIHERISTFDIDACTTAARKHKITGIMTMGTDQPVYTAACVSEELGLPSFLSKAQAFAVTNKKQMKQILTNSGIDTVRYRIVDCKTKANKLADMKTPLVIKPLDSQGQRGIYKLQTAEQILAHLENTLTFSRCQEALVEEYYESDEITVSGWLHNGDLSILTVTDRLLYPDPTHIGVCTGHQFPSIYMARYEEIETISRRVAAAFSLKNGPFYLQLLVGQDGIKVNELAARIGGAFEDVFIPWLTGFDILGAVLAGALGRPVDTTMLDSLRPDCGGKCVAVQLLFCSPGQIGRMTPLNELMNLPYVLDAGYNYEPGQVIPAVENATARLGHAVICGTADSIKERVDECYRHLSVTSVTGTELLKRCYP